MSRLTLTGIALAVSLAGCASAPPMLTQQELTSAQQTGNLETLYEQYATRLASYKLTTPEGQSALAQLNEIGNQLASKREQEIRHELSQQSAANEVIPLPVIEAQIARLPQMQKWSPEKHGKLAAELNTLKKRTQARIKAQQDALASLTEGEMGQRPALLAELTRLTGDNRYDTERSDVIRRLHHRAEESFQNGQYNVARDALLALKQATPDDKSLDGRLTLVDARLFEKQFWDTLASGQTDKAHAQLMSLSQSLEFPALLKGMSRSADDMVAYFVAEAGTATAENRLDAAYKLLGQARDIRLRTNASAARSPQEDAFLATVHARYQAASQSHPGVAFGYLKVIENFNPDYPGLPDEADILPTLTARATTPVEPGLSAEAHYETIARYYANAGDMTQATENVAYAYALARAKGQEARNLRKTLEEYAVQIQL